MSHLANMTTERYSSAGKPAAIARKALDIIKKNKPAGAHLTVFEIKESGSSHIAIGRSEDGILHNSKIAVEVRPGHEDACLIEVEANDDKFHRLLVRLRKEL